MPDVQIVATRENMHQRLLIGYAPWLPLFACDDTRWRAYEPMLRHMNFQAYLFQLTQNVYSSEIDHAGPPPNYTGPDGLAATLTGDARPGSLLSKYLRVMQFAHASGASVNLINAPLASSGAAAYKKVFPHHMKPFSLRAYASYVAEFVRWLKNDRGVPVETLHVWDEPRRTFDPERHNKVTPLYPYEWTYVYQFLDEEMKRRGCREGTSVAMLCDVPPWYWYKDDEGNFFDDVEYLLFNKRVNDAADDLCLAFYTPGSDDDRSVMPELVAKAQEVIGEAGDETCRVLFKDCGGVRVGTQGSEERRNATPQQQYDFGLDSVFAMLQGARAGADFFAQYFWVNESPSVHDPLFAVQYNGTPGAERYEARATMATYSLMTRTLGRRVLRMKDSLYRGPREVAYLATRNLPTHSPIEHHTYLFVNRAERAMSVELTPVPDTTAPTDALHRYWVTFGYSRGQKIQYQRLPMPAPGGKVTLSLPARSTTALTDNALPEPLNWPHLADLSAPV